MADSIKYRFELLVIDDTGKSGITVEKNLLYAIGYNEEIWKNTSISKNKIVDEDLKITLSVQSADIAGALSDMENNSVFFVKVEGDDFESIESFRKPLLVHLRKINFQHTRILCDDISTQLAKDVYPYINDVENRLRSFLVKFFIQKVGLNWWDVTAPKSVQDKVKSRKGNEPVFSSYIDCDVTLCDFDDLGELIYKQTTGFNSPEKIVDKILNTNSIDDLDRLKTDLQSNYTKYFKESFQDKSFDKKWKLLFAVRNKVAHNNLMTLEDKTTVLENVEYVKKIIEDAEQLIADFRFTTEDKQAFLDASVLKLTNEANNEEASQIADSGVKILGKIDLPEINETSSRYLVINEETLISHIEKLHNDGSDVSVKGVAELLAYKGYDRQHVYLLIDIMVDNGALEYYSYINQYGYRCRGVKVKQ